MLHWAAVSFVAALIVGMLGLGRLSAAAAAIAPVPFFVFVLSCAVAVAFGWRDGRASAGADAENPAKEWPTAPRFHAPVAS